ncbi:MAG: DUF5659 domain-containing protein [Patescibacteria group bacterium]
MANNQTKYYRTKDLGEASMLAVKKQKLTTIEKEGRICWFVFENKKECEQLANDYNYNEVLIDARSFHEAMSRLKGRIFSMN